MRAISGPVSGKFAASIALALAFNWTVGSWSLRADDKPEPALSTWIKELKDSGRLTVEFYEPGQPRQYEGWTVFEYKLFFEYECQLEWPRKKPRAGSVAIVSKFTKVELPVTHRMELPKRLEGERWYETTLARHELDHVRVGTHPRLAMLGKHLVKKLNRLERTVEKPADVTRDWTRKQIDDEVLRRKDAIEKLVMDINRHIDKVTRHGARPLENREQFLAELFLKENLDEMKFPYLADALDLLDTREYLQARVQTAEVDTSRPDEGKK